MKRINIYGCKISLKVVFCAAFAFLIFHYSRSQNLDSIKELAIKIEKPSDRIKFYNDWCEKIEGKALLNLAYEFLSYSNLVNSDNGRGLAYDNLGYYYQRVNLDTAIYFNKKALYFYHKDRNKEKVSRIFNELGVCYYFKGNLKKSLESYQKSYNLKTNKDISRKYALNNIALLYTKLGQKQEALKAYARLLNESPLNDKDSSFYGTVLQNTGVLYLELGNYEKAEEFLNKAVKYFNSELLLSQVKVNLGNCYMMQNQDQKALVLLMEALGPLKKLNEARFVSRVLGYLARIHMKNGNERKALSYALESLELAEKHHILENMDVNAKIISEAYERSGDYKNAMKFYRLHAQIHDSIGSENTRSQLMELSVKFESKQKDMEILKSQELINRKELQIQKQIIETRQKKRTIYITLGFSVLLMLLIFYVFRAYRQKQKANEIITAQKKEVEEQKAIIEHQKSIVEENQKEILDSIHYARRIQSALLAHSEFMSQHLPEHFVFFKPKDIVSGDFYWATKNNNFFYLAVCDSTGHGVPGAFMSLLGIGFLSEAINEKNIKMPGEVFNYVRNRFMQSVSRDGQQDGFDGILMCLNLMNGEVHYAAANNAPVIIHDHKVTHLPYNKMPVGISVKSEEFETYELKFEKGSTLYLYTDGYADQFGGSKGKKFMYKQLDELLLSIYQQDPAQQEAKLMASFEHWKGELEQVDDVCIVGIRL